MIDGLRSQHRVDTYCARHKNLRAEPMAGSPGTVFTDSASSARGATETVDWSRTGAELWSVNRVPTEARAYEPNTQEQFFDPC